MTQHDLLSPERWSAFSVDQQVLMIGNEMNRASKLLNHADRNLLTNSYERVLHLTDLTIQANPRKGLRREMLRWRDLVAELYLGAEGNPSAHAAAFRSLLTFTPMASRQRVYLKALVS